MNVIAVVAQKGGVGKTTVSQCLAVEALRQGIAAAIIDTDPQKSAAEWGSQREQSQIDAPAVLPLGSRPLKALVEELKKRGAQLVVIDTPPHSAPAINAALDVSTAAIMVTRPNPMDVRALEATWTIVNRMKKPAADSTIDSRSTRTLMPKGISPNDAAYETTERTKNPSTVQRAQFF